jgi:hypothetical protein
VLLSTPMAAQAPHVRVIPRSTSPRIDQRLQEDDEIVRIVEEEGNGIEFSADPSAEGLLAHLVGLSDVIAIVEVHEVTGTLAENGTWINTRVSATVREVFKDVNRPLRPGGVLRFEWSGGELKIGRVLLKTWAEPKLQLQTGRAYVLFGWVNPDNGVVYPAHVPARIDGNNLKIDGPLKMTAHGNLDPLDGYSLEKLVAEVRRVAQGGTRLTP